MQCSEDCGNLVVIATLKVKSELVCYIKQATTTIQSSCNTAVQSSGNKQSGHRRQESVVEAYRDDVVAVVVPDVVHNFDEIFLFNIVLLIVSVVVSSCIVVPLALALPPPNVVRPGYGGAGSGLIFLSR